MDRRIADDYARDVVEAALSVLVEVWTTLGSYRKALVLVGGAAPYLLLEKHKLPENEFMHVGTIDIDIAVDPTVVDSDAYATIVELLLKRGHRPKEDVNGRQVPSSFVRVVDVSGRQLKVQVDFMTGDDGRKHRHARLQPDFMARMTRGCELAFSHNFAHEFEGTLPGNGEVTVDVRVADLPAIITMKGFALGERYKEKDAYDIWATLANYGNGPADAAQAMKRALPNATVEEALDKIRAGFSSPRANGPAWVAAFVGGVAAEQERVKTDAFMVIDEFLRLCRAPGQR